MNHVQTWRTGLVFVVIFVMPLLVSAQDCQYFENKTQLDARWVPTTMAGIELTDIGVVFNDPAHSIWLLNSNAHILHFWFSTNITAGRPGCYDKLSGTARWNITLEAFAKMEVNISTVLTDETCNDTVFHEPYLIDYQNDPNLEEPEYKLKPITVEKTVRVCSGPNNGAQCKSGLDCGSGNCVMGVCSSDNTCFENRCPCKPSEIQCPTNDQCVEQSILEYGSKPTCRQEECKSGYVDPLNGTCAKSPEVTAQEERVHNESLAKIQATVQVEKIKRDYWSGIINKIITYLGFIIVAILITIAAVAFLIGYWVKIYLIGKKTKELNDATLRFIEEQNSFQRKREELKVLQENIGDIPAIENRLHQLAREEKRLLKCQHEAGQTEEVLRKNKEALKAIKWEIENKSTELENIRKEEETLPERRRVIEEEAKRVEESRKRLEEPQKGLFGNFWQWRNPHFQYRPCYVDGDLNNPIKTDRLIHIDIAERYIVKPYLGKMHELYPDIDFSTFKQGIGWLNKHHLEVHHIDRDPQNYNQRNLAVIRQEDHEKITRYSRIHNIPIYERSKNLQVLRQFGIQQPHLSV